MNWTEGNLARLSRGRRGKETVLKQKEHFAKARAAIINSSARKDTSVFSLFEPRQPTIGSQLSRRSASLTRPPNSLRKGHTGDADHRISHYWTSERNQPRVGSSTAAKPTFDVTPPDQRLAAKRRRLLAKPDWVGLDLQKPLNIDFSESHPTSRNGKWSKAKRQTIKPRPRDFVKPDEHDRTGSGLDISLSRRLNQLDPRNVKVTVGSQYMRLDDSSTVWRHEAETGSPAVSCSHCSSSRRSTSSSCGTLLGYL
jgi:hypothetical protein